jgi:hypothetical protein
LDTLLSVAKRHAAFNWRANGIPHAPFAWQLPKQGYEVDVCDTPKGITATYGLLMQDIFMHHA